MAQVLKMDNEEDKAAVKEEGAGGGKGEDDDEDKEEQPQPPLAPSATGSTAETPSASRSSALAGSDLAEEAMETEASVGVAVGSVGIHGGELEQHLVSFRALLQVYPKDWMPRDLADMVQRRQSACLGHVL